MSQEQLFELGKWVWFSMLKTRWSLQLLVRKGEEASSILQPLKILRNIVQSCRSGDVETVEKELELPHLLFSMIEDILNIPDLMQVRHKMTGGD